MYATNLLVAVLAGTCVANAASEFDRRDETCSIISPDGSKRTNCRSCPSLNCDVVTTVSVGDKVVFSGYASGDCYENNCTWDFVSEHKCYVNGYYTSSNCNHEVLSSMIISASGTGPTSAAPTSGPTHSGVDTSFGPTTTFNPAATATSATSATSATPAQSTPTSGSSKGLGDGRSTGLSFVLSAVVSFIWYC